MGKWTNFSEYSKKIIDRATHIDKYNFVSKRLKRDLDKKEKALKSKIDEMQTCDSNCELQVYLTAEDDAEKSIMAAMHVVGIAFPPLVNGVMPLTQIMSAFEFDCDQNFVNHYIDTLLELTTSALKYLQIMPYEHGDINKKKVELDGHFAVKIRAKPTNVRANVFFKNCADETKKYFTEFQNVSQQLKSILFFYFVPLFSF